MSVLVLVLAVLAGAFLSGCGGNPRAVSLLARADSLMDGRPDSALTVLDSLLADADQLSRRQEMRCRLLRLNAINKLDTVFTAAHAAQAQTLADYFDRHGTPNEQVLAHYILGRTYADQGETPRAVECYLDAVAKADTSSADCDYHTLGCAYSQMAEMYHRQLLLTNEIKAREQSRYYAEKAGETLNAISGLKLSAGAYILLNKRDTAESMLQEVLRQYLKNGYEQEAIQTSIMLMHLYVDQPKRHEELKYLINQYDEKSEAFDFRHELQNANRQFYYYCGKYYEGINQLDSAELYYRKIEYPKMPFTAKDFMYSGLLSVFKKKEIADSIAKYSQLYCAVNDSSIILRDQQITAQLTASYKYNSMQKELFKNAKRSYVANIRSICLLIALIAAISVIALIVWKSKKNQKQMEARYNKAIVERSKIREELNSLKMNNYDEVISQKEKEIERLTHSITQHEERLLQTTARNNLVQFQNSDIVQLFSRKRQFKKDEEPLTGNDWKQLISQFGKNMPSAFAVMTSSNLSSLQFHVCILLLLDYEESIIAALRDTKPQTINNAKIRANKKMFMADNSTSLKSNLMRLIAT